VAGQRRHAQAGQPRARAAALTLPRRHIPLERVRRFAPSLRSLLIGLCLVAAALGAYALARGTSAFAIQRVVVTGATPAVHRDVRQAVAPLVGTSLLSLHGGGLLRRVDDLPTVLSARYDRAFPHTLRLWVVPERPVAVVRRGRESWLVSARGRVIARIPQGGDPTLARVWVKRVTPLRPGSFVDAQAAGTAAQALALATRFPARIATASLVHGELVFRLRIGVELRLGAPNDIRLKLAIARRALRGLPTGSTYLDVSVPERPVAGTDSQLSGRA
jgi:cell division protein FtsQ